MVLLVLQCFISCDHVTFIGDLPDSGGRQFLWHVPSKHPVYALNTLIGLMQSRDQNTVPLVVNCGQLSGWRGRRKLLFPVIKARLLSSSTNFVKRCFDHSETTLLGLQYFSKL